MGCSCRSGLCCDVCLKCLYINLKYIKTRNNRGRGVLLTFSRSALAIHQGNVIRSRSSPDSTFPTTLPIGEPLHRCRPPRTPRGNLSGTHLAAESSSRWYLYLMIIEDSYPDQLRRLSPRSILLKQLHVISSIAVVARLICFRHGCPLDVDLTARSVDRVASYYQPPSVKH